MKGRAISYSAAELAFIESRCAESRSAICAAFAAEFNRADVHEGHIKALCTRHGWVTPRAPWSPDEDAILRDMYPDHRAEEIAQRLGRALQATWRRAHVLGLSKSAAFQASAASGRLRTGTNTGAAHRFRRGRVSPDKGVRRPEGARGRSRETLIGGQRGVQPGWNKRPVGSTRLHDGYLWTKVSELAGVSWLRNWKATHVLRWEQLHGAVPKSMALKCLDGDKLNTEPSNWEAVPKGMLPRLNGGRLRRMKYDEAPAALRPTIMAVAKLEHAVRSRTRQAEKVSA